LKKQKNNIEGGNINVNTNGRSRHTARTS